MSRPLTGLGHFVARADRNLRLWRRALGEDTENALGMQLASVPLQYSAARSSLPYLQVSREPQAVKHNPGVLAGDQ